MKLIIIRPEDTGYSGTFLRDQERYLRETSDCRVVYGLALPETDECGHAFVPRFGGRHALAWARAHITREPWQTTCLRQFYRYLVLQAPDVVLAQYGQAGAGIAECCSTANVPLVVHFHGFDAYRTDVLKAYRDRYETMFRVATRLVAVSRDMCGQLVKLGADRSRVAYIPYGVNLDLFRNATPDQSAPAFLAVGRLVEKKAPHLLILAFSKVARQQPAASLTLVGDGPLTDSCRQLVRALGLQNQVSFPGPQPHEEIARLMQASHFFVQHSVTSPDGDSEGTPVAILEAGASGLPVVSTRHAGIKDVVEEGETGLLVDEYDVEAMASAMLRLAGDPRLAARLGSNARRRIAIEFDQRKSLARLFSIMQDAANSAEHNIGSRRAHRRHKGPLKERGAC